MYARNVVRLDARPAVGLVVNDDAGANTVAMTREMERTLETLLREVPAV
jgi:multidrug efflux pump subunit AcrB